MSSFLNPLLNDDNRLFTLTRQGGRPPSAAVSIAVVFVVLVLAIIPGQLLGHIVLLTRDGVPRLPIAMQYLVEPIIRNLTIFPLIYVGLWVWLQVSSKRPFRTLGLERRQVFRRALRGAAVAGLMMAATAGLSVIPGASLTPGLLQMMGPAAFGIRFLSLLSYFVQGPAEEVLFRGWLLPVTGARYRPWIGVVVSSVIFSLAHSLSPGITAIGFLNLFLFGVFASFYALAEGGLWGIGAWHAVWNWAMGRSVGICHGRVTPHWPVEHRSSPGSGHYQRWRLRAGGRSGLHSDFSEWYRSRCGTRSPHRRKQFNHERVARSANGFSPGSACKGVSGQAAFTDPAPHGLFYVRRVGMTLSAPTGTFKHNQCLISPRSTPSLSSHSRPCGEGVRGTNTARMPDVEAQRTAMKKLGFLGLGLISFDDETGTYRMRAFNDGRWLETEVKLEDGADVHPTNLR